MKVALVVPSLCILGWQLLRMTINSCCSCTILPLGTFYRVNLHPTFVVVSQHLHQLFPFMIETFLLFCPLVRQLFLMLSLAPSLSTPLLFLSELFLVPVVAVHILPLITVHQNPSLARHPLPILGISPVVVDLSSAMFRDTVMLTAMDWLVQAVHVRFEKSFDTVTHLPLRRKPLLPTTVVSPPEDAISLPLGGHHCLLHPMKQHAPHHAPLALKLHNIPTLLFLVAMGIFTLLNHLLILNTSLHIWLTLLHLC